jgi:hypothetical protein
MEGTAKVLDIVTVVAPGAVDTFNMKDCDSKRSRL